VLGGGGAVTETRPRYMTQQDADYAAMSDLERAWDTYFRLFAPRDMQGYVREYEFHPDRGWRFDFAWQREVVAVELDGGTWMQGRHTRGDGYRNDCEKRNEATLLGWAVFHFTTDMLHDDPRACVDIVVRAIQERRV